MNNNRFQAHIYPQTHTRLHAHIDREQQDQHATRTFTYLHAHTHDNRNPSTDWHESNIKSLSLLCMTPFSFVFDQIPILLTHAGILNNAQSLKLKKNPATNNGTREKNQRNERVNALRTNT